MQTLTIYLSSLDHILSYVQDITLFVLVNKSIEIWFTDLLNDIWRVYLPLKKFDWTFFFVFMFSLQASFCKKMKVKNG